MTQYKNILGHKDKAIHMAQLKTEHLSGQKVVKETNKPEDKIIDSLCKKFAKISVFTQIFDRKIPPFKVGYECQKLFTNN